MRLVCNLCDSTAFSPVYQLEDFSVLECNHCSLILRWPLPSEVEKESVDVENPASHYEEYYREFRGRTYSRIMQTLLNSVGTGKILDVGCGRGRFLEIAAEDGFQPYGIELLDEQASCARAKFGANVSIGRFEEADYQTSSFDVIAFLDVLEHLRDPKALVIVSATRSSGPSE